MKSTIIVVPCFNEAARLPVDEFQRFAGQYADVGFLFVNDGSTDSTRQVLDRLHHADALTFRVLHLDRNQGKAEAVRQGILEAIKTPCAAVGYWDADLATPLDELPAFLDYLPRWPKVQLIMGARVKLLGRNIRRRALRHYLSRVFASAASQSLRLAVYDTQCGAKLFRVSPTIERLFEQPFLSQWLFDVELLFRLLRTVGSSGEEMIVEHPLRQWVDITGSKVKAKDFFKAFVELLRIRRAYRKR